MNKSEIRRRARDAASKVLRAPNSSKKCKTARGSALSSNNVNPWQVRRKQSYTQIGIDRLKCIRCGDPAEFQWQICADNNHYRPICGGCDIKLNRMVLKFMRHPHWGQLASEYEERKNG